MNLSLKRTTDPATASDPPVLTVKPGDLLLDWQGIYHVVTATKGTDRVVLQRFGKRPVPPKTIDPSQFMSYWREDMTINDWQLISRDNLHRPDWAVFEDGKEVTPMADRPTNVLTPPRMTKADWVRRDKTRVTLTRGELEYLAQLVAAGHALIRDGRSISPLLRAAMSRLGISTRGL
jgi:hypothetical protein